MYLMRVTMPRALLMVIIVERQADKHAIVLILATLSRIVLPHGVTHGLRAVPRAARTYDARCACTPCADRACSTHARTRRRQTCFRSVARVILSMGTFFTTKGKSLTKREYPLLIIRETPFLKIFNLRPSCGAPAPRGSR